MLALLRDQRQLSVTLLPSYGIARVLLAGDAKARKCSTAQRFVHEGSSDHQRLGTTHSLSQSFAPYWQKGRLMCISRLARGEDFQPYSPIVA